MCVYTGTKLKDVSCANMDKNTYNDILRYIETIRNKLEREEQKKFSETGERLDISKCHDYKELVRMRYVLNTIAEILGYEKVDITDLLVPFLPYKS